MDGSRELVAVSSAAGVADPGLPIVDFCGRAGDPAVEAAIARQLDAAFSCAGFCYVRNIGVSATMTNAVFAASRRFHALPDSEKRALAMNAAHRGYMAPNTWMIETSTLAQTRQTNCSESLTIMHEVAPDDPRRGQPLQGPNQWPDLPGFRAIVQAYDAALRRFCLWLLRPMALALGLSADWFAPHFREPTTTLRLVHYPSPPPGSRDDEAAAAPQTDYGFITMLAQDRGATVEVRRRDGQWTTAHPIPGAWLVNVADMLSRWTNGRWQSVPYRVRNLPGGDRYAIPYLFDMGMNSVVECLPTCLAEGETPQFPAVHYGDYLMEKLDLNYAYRKWGRTPATAYREDKLALIMADAARLPRAPPEDQPG
jgi:isopenicillin N synthase-like dioxygenase